MNNARQQRGYALWVILAACLAAILAAKWWHDRSKQQRLDEAIARERSITAERVAQERREREVRETAERREFEERLAAERARSDYERSADAFRAMHAKWTEASRVAGVTARVALSGPVATLQSIRREATAMALPTCLQDARNMLGKAMQQEIDAYITFMADADFGKLLAEVEIKEARKLAQQAKEAAEACPRGA